MTILLVLLWAQAVFANPNGPYIYNSIQYLNGKSAQSPCKEVSLCSSFVVEILNDDLRTGFLGLEPRTPLCNQTKVQALSKLDSNVVNQNLNTHFSEEMGSFTSRAAKRCKESINKPSAYMTSKMYYYLWRLNEGALKINSDRVRIANYLKKTPPDCPHINVLNKAYKSCEELRNCKVSSDSLDDLESSLSQGLETYNLTIAEIKKNSECSNLECRKKLELLKGLVESFQEKYPMLLDEDFVAGAKDKKNIKASLQKYFEKKDQQLLQLQDQVENAAGCVQGIGQCGLEETRELMGLMPEYQENKKDVVLQASMNYEICVEDAISDRNKTSKILSDTTRDALLTIATAGMGAIPQLARIGLGSKLVNRLKIGASASTVSLDGVYAYQSWQEANKICDAISVQGMENHSQCYEIESPLSLRTISKADCRSEKLIAALSVLPLSPVMAQHFSKVKKIADQISASTPVPKIRVQEVARNSISNSTQLDMKQISSLKPVSGDGYGYKEILKGNYHGKSVFVKVSPLKKNGDKISGSRTIRLLNNEVAWCKQLDEAGVGPKFYGASETADGNYALIMEDIPGYHFGNFNEDLLHLPKDFNPSAALLEKLKRIRSFIVQNKIKAYDLQIRYNENDAKIIDPEFFSFADSQDEVRQNLQEINKLINLFEKRVR